MNKENIYYHFLSCNNALDDLKNDHIRVAKLSDLNDPFEGKPYLRYSLEERRPYNKAFKELARKWGLLCFSKTWKGAQLLWSHYAHKHKGVALGFEISGNDIIEVQYTNQYKRPKFNNAEEYRNSFCDLLHTKHDCWKYEEEYRLLIELKADKDDYFMPFGHKLILKKIILGCRFENDKNKEQMVKYAKKFGAEITQARIGWENYLISEDGTKTARLQAIKVSVS